MARMVTFRAKAKAAMDPTIHLLPQGVADSISQPAEMALPPSGLRYYFPWWISRLVEVVLRRKKKDWNEVLRLTDVPTMDYAR